MAVKRGRIITVEGCPCEVVDERVNVSDDTSIYFAFRKLCVAPDGSLFVVNPFFNDKVSVLHGNEGAMKRKLRRLAREMRP